MKIYFRYSDESSRMARFNPNKQDLVPGFSDSCELFRKRGLEIGQTFTNKHGTKLIVESANFSDKCYVQALEDTGLEEDTEAILSDIRIDSQHYEKQYHPDGTSKNYRIDFAFPSIRLAIEPHASYLWEVNDGQEEEKEADLNEIGWDVLWLDEDDLSDKGQAKMAIKTTMQSVLKNINYLKEDDGSLTLLKIPLPHKTYVTYQIDDSTDTVVYQGREVPHTIATLEQQIQDTDR